jgi:tetratricopeptide (TPR) repeat protein
MTEKERLENELHVYDLFEKDLKSRRLETARAARGLGALAVVEGFLEEALTYYERANELDPDNTDSGCVTALTAWDTRKNLFPLVLAGLHAITIACTCLALRGVWPR